MKTIFLFTLILLSGKLAAQKVTTIVTGATGDNANIHIGNPNAANTTNDPRAGIWLDNDGRLKFRSVTGNGFSFRNAGNNVKVETANFPDDVFKQGNHLPSLSTLKRYIAINQHLPEMPSEMEVVSAGIDLGEMNKLLVKKVEELTLYLISTDSQLSDQHTQLNKQQKVIVKQSLRLSALEKALARLTDK